MSELAYSLHFGSDKILKIIPIIKDIDNPKYISNKFKLDIITTTIKTIKKP